ncbi:hypothetical protein CRE_23444 [Caenorhabditis remanei]|uniref:F-box domain-containing protein n=1 Tax=Caenorhabditis remanei TaxID=31234 RepID=E3MGS6_CAERE|nr:hypothetical protein CRE_23444 [Caenorhabditis remanei]
MTDESPLLRLPEVTINHILYFCDYLEIARLCNVCHSLRNHIDFFKPDAHVDEVWLGNQQNAEMYFKTDKSSRIWVGYTAVEGGCRVECMHHMNSRSVTTISGMDRMDALIQDFKIYLRHLKTPLKKFKLNRTYCDPLIQIMRSQPPESRIFPLKVNELELYGLSQDHILATLSLFDANYLKDLKIENETEGDELNDGAEDYFHALFETEQWKNAERICLSHKFKISSVRQISHLKEFGGSISRVTAADVEFLKNTFISSPLFEECRITADVDIDVLSITEAFGAPSYEVIEGIAHLWYFHIPNDTNSALSVKVINEQIIDIDRINRRRVIPGVAIIY